MTCWRRWRRRQRERRAAVQYLLRLAQEQREDGQR